jgi:proteasome lid subunit RPN8/RPN11
MTSSTRLTTVDVAAAELTVPAIRCARARWADGVTQLARRGAGVRESGAFLLGQREGPNATIEGFAYYDDLEPGCLDAGMVVLTGAAYGPLWALCRSTGRTVVADVHTHPRRARQSDLDRRHPMIANAGHVAIIVPDYAQHAVALAELGVYLYRGGHAWLDYSGPSAADVLILD